jgi:hypothetical protein
MIRSICNDYDDNCLNVETVVCKVYFPQNNEETHAITWPTVSCELKQSRNKEIRRFHINNNKSFDQFFELITSSIVEPSADVELLVLGADSDWIPVDCDEQWAAALNGARIIPNKKHRQLRVKVTARDGSSVTPKPAGTKKPSHVRTTSRRNTSCCIVPTKTDAYPCFESSNFLSIKQDFCDVQKQLEAMRLQHQTIEGQQGKKKKKTSDKKKKRSSKSSDIVTQIAYHHADIFNNWGSSKWGSETSSSIAVL